MVVCHFVTQNSTVTANINVTKFRRSQFSQTPGTAHKFTGNELVVSVSLLPKLQAVMPKKPTKTTTKREKLRKLECSNIHMTEYLYC